MVSSSLGVGRSEKVLNSVWRPFDPSSPCLPFSSQRDTGDISKLSCPSKNIWRLWTCFQLPTIASKSIRTWYPDAFWRANRAHVLVQSVLRPFELGAELIHEIDQPTGSQRGTHLHISHGRPRSPTPILRSKMEDVLHPSPYHRAIPHANSAPLFPRVANGHFSVALSRLSRPRYLVVLVFSNHCPYLWNTGAVTGIFLTTLACSIESSHLGQ